MKKTSKMLCIVLAVAMLIPMVAIVANGVSIQHVFTTGGLTNTIQAQFVSGEKGCGEYGTNTSKVVTRAYVRLQEGSYDSQRQYSGLGSSVKKGTTVKTAKLSKANNLFQICYTNYGWEY